jgi:hypothetical protein
MSKQNSIRSAANMMFMQLLPSRKEIGNKAFRRNVMHYLCETFDITVAAAATHYNHAFQRIKESEPELVEGLGRPEGKNNGGRKKKEAPAQLTAAEVVNKPAEPLHEDFAPTQTVFSVKRSKDGAVVAEGLSFEDAKTMVEKAAAQKKAKLYWV